MGSLSRLAIVPVVLGLAALMALPASGCLRNQLRRREESGTRRPAEVLKAAEDVLKERYYQVKTFNPKSQHLRALSPVRLHGNQPMRKQIDVYVLQENGFYMPYVYVRSFIDTSEPEIEKGGPIVGRFPIEQSDHPVPGGDWQPLMYDRNEEQELYKAILARLNIPS